MQLKGHSSSPVEDDFELVDAEDARIPQAARARTDPATVRSRHDFKILVECLQRTADSHRPFNKPMFHARLFPSDSNTNIYQFFLDNIAPELQHEHCCHACRSFLIKYGDLCVVSEATGALVPLFWPDKRGSVPAMYQKAVEAVRDLFRDKEVAGDYHIFVERHRHLGVARSSKPAWYHLNVVLTLAPVGKPPHELLDFDTAFTMLSRVMEENSMQVINTAHHLLHEKLPYSTSHKPSIEWLQTTATKYHRIKSNAVGAGNLVHHHSRSAWIGLLPSLRSGVIGELLASIREGLQYHDIEARWVSLTNPKAYLRPIAAPSSGSISVAEKKLQMLGYTKDDLMRYQTATDELPASAILWKNDKLWSRRPAKDSLPEGSIFGGLKAASKTRKVEEPKGDGAPPTSISFRKFAQRVLPTASSIEILLKEKTTATFFTRGGEGAKSPFVFDCASRSNTMSWYYWDKALPVSTANLKTGWNAVTGIVTFPHMWDYLTPEEAADWEDEDAEDREKKWIHSRHGVRFMFCLQDAKEMNKDRSLCLFPALMKSEFHGIRKTIEAYSNDGRIGWDWGEGKSQVGGVARKKDGWVSTIVRVTNDKKITTQYEIALFD